MSGPEPDLSYNTANVRAYAANLVAAWNELRQGGMDRKEALAVVIALVQTLAVANR